MTRGRAEAGTFTLLERRVDHPDSVRLLREFYEEQVRRYGTADPIDLDPQEYAPPNGIFFVGYAEHQTVGCAGARWSDRHRKVVEIKKIFLRPAVRGRGFGGLLLSGVESWAIEQGSSETILETGVRNAAAISLFESHGFQPMASYVAGRDPTVNRAFTKRLAQVWYRTDVVAEPDGTATAPTKRATP